MPHYNDIRQEQEVKSSNNGGEKEPKEKIAFDGTALGACPILHFFGLRIFASATCSAAWIFCYPVRAGPIAFWVLVASLCSTAD
jgi:hypothetical protein